MKCAEAPLYSLWAMARLALHLGSRHKACQVVQQQPVFKADDKGGCIHVTASCVETADWCQLQTRLL